MGAPLISLINVIYFGRGVSCRVASGVRISRIHPDSPGDWARTDNDGIGEDDAVTRELSVPAEASGPTDLAGLLPTTPFTFPDRRRKG